jgi:NAD(P)-dependent dehydrogenase (short-subunit alcohol dehydrogenase family)
MKLANKRAIITGASQGFGLAVAEAYVREGCSVVICARNGIELERTAEGLKTKAPAGVRVEQTICDVGDAISVSGLFAFGVERLGGVDVVVSNAGVYGPKGPTEEISAEEFGAAVQINLMGTLYVCQEALKIFKRQRSGKIILLSGGGATKPMPNIASYAATKAAVVRLGETLAEEVRGMGIDINSVAPGALNTRLLDEVLAAGPEKVGKAFYEASIKQRDGGGSPLEKGAGLCVYLASAASDGVTGKLISAVWDPWATLKEKLAEWRPFDKSGEIYTLRRIVPEDRVGKA